MHSMIPPPILARGESYAVHCAVQFLSGISDLPTLGKGFTHKRGGMHLPLYWSDIQKIFPFLGKWFAKPPRGGGIGADNVVDYLF